MCFSYLYSRVYLDYLQLHCVHVRRAFVVVLLNSLTLMAESLAGFVGSRVSFVNCRCLDYLVLSRL